MKARRITLDVETYRTRNAGIVARVEQDALDKRPAQNTLKELKTLWDTDAARGERAREALAKTALDVLIAEILCVCWRVDGEPHSVNGMVRSEQAALLDLAEGWDEMAGPETIWCGHNIAGFDLPVILNAWRRHGITPPKHFPCYIDRWRGRIFDTMRRVPCANGLGFVSLAAVCEAYGLVCPKATEWLGAPMDGSRVGAAFEAGAWETVLEYCDEDTQVTETLYLHMTGNDTHSTFDRPDQIAAEIAEIEASELPDSTKKISVYTVMDRAGLIPRVA
jgi:DNA polymerase III epsilon subunit-like protein